MLTTTAKEFRPDGPASSHAAEDLQPNEAINKRQGIAPPTVLPASVKPPLPYKGLARRGRNSGGDIGIRPQGAGSFHGNLTQHPLRGNTSRQGHSHSGTRDVSRTRLSHLHPLSRTPTNNTRFLVTAEPSILKRQSDTMSRPHTTIHPIPRKPSGALPPVPKHNEIEYAHRSNTAYQRVPNQHKGTGQPATAPEQPRKYSSINPLPQTPPVSSSSVLLNRSASPPMILRRSPTPPSKRRKLDHTPEPSAIVKVEEIEPSTHLQPPIHVKLEVVKAEKRSSSPPSRRLVTDSCSFYPLPEDCRKSNPNHRKNRQAFFAQEYNVLKCLGLKRTKVFFRDDGMVIEWTTSTPVWSDTLRPEPSNLSSVIGEALQANRNAPSGKRKSTTPQSISASAENNTVVVEATCSSGSTPSPRSPPGQHKLPTSQLTPPLPRRLPHKPRLPQVTPNIENAQLILPTTMKNNPGIQPVLAQDMDRDNDCAISTSASAAITDRINASRARACFAEELEKVEPMAVDYLQRYLRTFDSDRSALQDAYTEDALFSYRIALISPSSSTSQSSSFISYRLPQVTSSLSSILPSYKFCLRDGAGEIHYDVVSLDGQAGGGILLTVHGALSRADANADLAGKSEYDHIVAVDQSFVLHQKDANDDRKEIEDAGGTGEKERQSRWPLVAVSHQMVVRDIDVRSGRIKLPLPIASTSLLLDHFPWLTQL